VYSALEQIIEYCSLSTDGIASVVGSLTGRQASQRHFNCLPAGARGSKSPRRSDAQEAYIRCRLAADEVIVVEAPLARRCLGIGTGCKITLQYGRGYETAIAEW